eukprot:s1009_g18.t1
MWESDACADRMLSFVSFRYHLLFFYRPVTPQVHGTNDNGQPEPPMLQQAMMSQRRMDAIGRSISEELRVLFLAYRHRATALEYVVHPMIIQNLLTFVPVTYMSPAIPHVIVTPVCARRGKNPSCELLATKICSTFVVFWERPVNDI